MTDKYKSLEHTIRDINQSKYINEENVELNEKNGVGSVLGKIFGGGKPKPPSSGKPSGGKPSKPSSGTSARVADLAAAIGAGLANANTAVVPVQLGPVADGSGMPVNVSSSTTGRVSTARTPKNIILPTYAKEQTENLNELGVLGTDEYKGVPRAFSKATPRIEPKKGGDNHNVSSIGASGNRSQAKKTASPTMHGAVSEENNSSKERKKIKNVSRPDSKSPNSVNNELSRQSEITTKIIDDERLKEMLIGALKKKKKPPNSGVTGVEINPEMKTKGINEQITPKLIKTSRTPGAQAFKVGKELPKEPPKELAKGIIGNIPFVGTGVGVATGELRGSKEIGTSLAGDVASLAIGPAARIAGRAISKFGKYIKPPVGSTTGSTAPKALPPKAEPPKAAPPKAEPPKAEPPKAAPPKAEPPKALPPPAGSPPVRPPVRPVPVPIPVPTGGEEKKPDAIVPPVTRTEPPKTETPKAEPPVKATPRPTGPKPKPEEDLQRYWRRAEGDIGASDVARESGGKRRKNMKESVLLDIFLQTVENRKNNK
jgi:hypothetical protein